jgi:hypothetical protein
MLQGRTITQERFNLIEELKSNLKKIIFKKNFPLLEIFMLNSLMRITNIII